MFRQRRSSQKPGDDLLANVRQQFPEVAAVSFSAATENPLIPPGPLPERPQDIGRGAFCDQDPTPRAMNEPWRFTPSLLDPNSISFASFANAPPGYYTPSPGGTNTLFHPEAGDLHTLTMGLGMGLGTPLSMPTLGDVMQPRPVHTAMEMTGFQTSQPHQFHHCNPFIQPPPPQQAFAPSTFVHQDTCYETMDQDDSPMDLDPSEERMPSIGAARPKSTSMVGLKTSQFPGGQMTHQLPPSAEKFRFHCTLNAPTVMIKHADEIPGTYLNIGKAYSLSVTDANATMPVSPGTKYRTFFRISFEDDQQRQQPGVYWGLWQKNRGANEAHQRGGKLQAVEYVDAGQPADWDDDDKRTHVKLESSSFDGFSVIWTPGINGPPAVNIAVRFNVLSTDFSDSKGVKGMPARLCAKTNRIPCDTSQRGSNSNPEICFCKVKLFRDHGAERKLSNDVAHVKKSIDKLERRIAQAESGLRDFGKRKRSSGAAKVGGTQRRSRMQKHKRTWPISSVSSTDGGNSARVSMEEDLPFQLQTLQDMFTSTRSVSVLYLRGEELDDPDLHPVPLLGAASPLTRSEGCDGPNWQARSGRRSVAGFMISPSPSSLSLVPQSSGICPGGQWQGFDSLGAGDVSRKGSEAPTRISKTDNDGILSGWIEALGVDPSYRPPQARCPKPVACFSILRHNQETVGKPEYHRAIYLLQRTLKELNDRIAAKWGLDPFRILRTVHSIHGGLEVEMDDDIVRELRNGQDMTLEIDEVVKQPAGVKREWEMAADSIGDAPNPAMDKPTSGFVLRLTF
ncbi:CP2 transcription factor-domain-containing protein [Thelonectria olida]|uniref:CP2 transcription factor-domain-containing protein n=1 Tax=Thelonectria olida TaxID=1576542 RepID=A0A9P8VRL5_9HYPO|nr:CP2 transcription factor-domain-containing protein [Thelonectria olida]